MKREVKRQRVLPAFKVDIADLGLLWQRCVALFTEGNRLHSTLTLELPGETLKFSSMEELAAADGLPAKVLKFSLWMSEGDRHVSLRSSSLLWSRPEVSASGETEAWCAGAVETVYAFLANHKATYSWFIAAPLGWMLVLFAYVTPLGLALASKYVQPELRIPLAAAYGWGALIVVLSLLFFARARLFPMTVLTLREEQGFLRRHVAELSLFVAVVSAVLSIIGWFVAK